MTAPSTPLKDAGEIARGLSRGERDIVTSSNWQVAVPAYAIARKTGLSTHSVASSIRRMGLHEKVSRAGARWWHYRLNTLGEEVRRILEGEGQ